MAFLPKAKQNTTTALLETLLGSSTIQSRADDRIRLTG